MEKYSVIGKSLPRVDAVVKATGEAKYTADMPHSGMLHGKILRSPYPHARVLMIDTTKAERLLGVKAVITGKDITNIPHGPARAAPAPPWFKDKFALAKEKVRYIGDEVAAVAAIDEDIAEEALDLIEVEYEELPSVFDPKEAMKPDAPRIHDHAERNISAHASFHLGDVEKGFQESDLVMEEHFETQYVCHSPLEPHAVAADFSQSGEVTLWVSTQTPFFDQVVVAEALGIPVSKVRVIKPHVGGGFGGKADSNPPFPIAALLSKKAGRPVKIVHTREEEIVCTARRHPVIVEQKIGVKKDGRIMAVDSRLIANGGAYNSIGPLTIYLHGGFQNGPYMIPNFKYEGNRIYTNKPFCGPQRGHGALQTRFVVESMLDMIAEKLDLDPLEIRRKNGLKAGDITPSKFIIRSSGHIESIERASDEIGWKDKWGKLPEGKGVGIASNFFVSGAGFSFFFDNPPSHSGVNLEAKEDGGFTLFTGTSDIGQGSLTVLSQIAAEELGVSLDQIRVIAADTAITPLDFGSFSSRVTLFAGNAAKMAASRMRQILLEVAAESLEANIDDLEARGNRIYVKGSPEKGISVSEAVRAYFQEKKEPLSTKGHYNPPIDVGDASRFDKGEVNMSPTFSFGAHAAEVEVDKETGMVKVHKVAAAHDCGFAINPMSVEGQIEGSVSMTFGQALLEDFQMEKGWAMNPSFLGYKLPTAVDMPQVKSIIVESLDPEGPFGAKEASEGTNIPTIPAIANAIYDAIGVRIKDLPITPEKILKALEEN
ncbi:MAG TPA: xanthine dehydrogenase family protein molybdopterin-binding subunit [Syntrophales bacterium]|nr:xanthine dehydrogenase family protein molybdopterin-binding subunit [Syntrophales bacterium]